MLKIVMPLLFILVIALPGCGSVLSTLNVGTINEHPGKRTVAQILEDDNIETKITVNIHAQNEAYHNNHLLVVSYNGYVLLAGQVADAALKSGATAVARNVKGVRRIYNELEIGAPTSALTRTNDAWVTTRIKSVLLGSDDTPGTQVKVVTENGVVYLLGLVTTKEADNISDKAAMTPGVQRVVRMFEITDS